MKKLAFLFAAVVAVSFASCGQKTGQQEECTDSVCEVVEEEVCSDSSACACDTCTCDTCKCAEAPVAE